MQYISVVILVLMLSAPLVMAGGGSDQAVIILGDERLERDEFKQQFEIAMVFKAIQTGVPVKNQDQIYVMEHRFLEQRAQDMVLYRMAREQGITVSDQTLDQYLDEFMQSLGFSSYSKSIMAQLGFDTDATFRDYMREKQIISILTGRIKAETETDASGGLFQQRIDEIVRQSDIRVFPDVVDALPQRD